MLNECNDNNIQKEFISNSPEVFLKHSFSNFISSAKKLEKNYDLLKQEVVKLKEELKQKDLEIKRKENLATIGQTASAIAHEIRNPLGAMKLFISILKSDLKENFQVQDTLKQIDICISSLDNVVSNVLQFSKNNKNSFSPINIISIIKEQLGILKCSIKKEIVVEENYNNDNIFVLGNEASLGRVFYNLFLNSIQAQKENPYIRVSASLKEKEVVVQVCDHGNGIKEEILSKIFDPFVSTKNEGTGLGLAVVKQILDSHNAKITARNGDSKGHDGARGAIFEIIFNC